MAKEVLDYEGLKYYDEKLKALIKEKEDKIYNILNILIDDDDNKSIRTIATEEIFDEFVPEDAREDMNTIEEIATWIQTHSSTNISWGKLGS